MNSVYNRIVNFQFEFEGEFLSTSGVRKLIDGGLVLEFSETRCNGQEDSRVGGMLELINGKWSVVDGECRNCIDYRDEHWLERLCEFLDKNQPPNSEYNE